MVTMRILSTSGKAKIALLMKEVQVPWKLQELTTWSLAELQHKYELTKRKVFSIMEFFR